MKTTKLTCRSEIALAARVLTVLRSGAANGDVDADTPLSELRELKGFAEAGGNQLSNRELIKVRNILFELYDVILQDYIEELETE